MRKCISRENREYNEQEQFVSYTLEKRNGARSYIVQFVRGEGEEQFFRYSLEDSAGPGAGEREFSRRKRIMNREDVEGYLAEEGTRYALNIVPKRTNTLNNLDVIISSFESVDAIRATGLSQALAGFCRPFIEATGINLNPVELTLEFFEGMASKKVEGRCAIL